MAFTLNQTEAKIVYKMQDPIKTDDLYQKLEGMVSRGHLYNVIKTLLLKKFIAKVETLVGAPRNVRYRANQEGIREAMNVLDDELKTEQASK